MTTIREQLKALELLQEIDSRVDGLKKQKTALIAQLKPLQDKLTQSTALVMAKATEVEDARKTVRQAQAAMELCQDRLTRSNGKLEGVSKGNEFQAVTKEIDQLKKQISTVQDQIKNAQSVVDVKSLEMAQFQEKQTQTQGELDQIKNQLASESGKIDDNLQALEGERAPHINQVGDSRLVLQYDRIRGMRAGIGIAPTVSGRCKACNMLLPPQQYIQIQKGQEIHNCPSCGRLLFHPVQ